MFSTVDYFNSTEVGNSCAICLAWIPYENDCNNSQFCTLEILAFVCSWALRTFIPLWDPYKVLDIAMPFLASHLDPILERRLET